MEKLIPMIGKSLAHYKILDTIGSGGMGEVYRARDTKLERDVAIKVLPGTFRSNKKALVAVNLALSDEGGRAF